MSEKEWEPDIARSFVTCGEAGAGVLVYLLHPFNADFPAGVAMCHGRGDAYDLLDIYVRPDCRRRGVARALIRAMLLNVSLIRTDKGTADGGQAMLEAVGFKYDEIARVWVLSK
jgi:GNAT superfamily N-acetyltransferase